MGNDSIVHDIRKTFPLQKSDKPLEMRLALFLGSLIRERDYKKSQAQRFRNGVQVTSGYAGSTSLDGTIERVQNLLDGYDDQFDYYPGSVAKQPA